MHGDYGLSNQCATDCAKVRFLPSALSVVVNAQADAL